MASIPVFSATVASDELGAALRDAGCAVVHGVVAHDVRDRMAEELGPHVTLADPRPDGR